MSTVHFIRTINFHTSGSYFRIRSSLYEEGWGRQANWGNSGWGVEYAVQPTGQQATTAVGRVFLEC